MTTTTTDSTVEESDVAVVRGFSRFYTRILGLLDEHLLETPYSLTQARVLYELGQCDSMEVVELREVVGVDAGYLSRLLSRLVDAGLVDRERSGADRRRQVLSLTDPGRATFADLDGRSKQQVHDLLASLDAGEQRRVVTAMQTVRSVMANPTRSGRSGQNDSVRLRTVGTGDLGWIVQRHGQIYAEEYGWDETFEALVARVTADFVDARRRNPKQVEGWIAELDGQPVGCIFCVDKDTTTAQLRLLLVDPMARGAGIGGRLIDQCLDFARQAGYERMVLWTNDVLADARRLYMQAGFELVDEGPHHSFGHDLVEQTWSLDL